MTRFFNREIVAVRWKCRSCERTAVGPPDRLAEGWVEVDPPPWHGPVGPYYACSDHAAAQLAMARRQWARFTGRVHEVDVAEYEATKASLRTALRRLEQLRGSGQRGGHP